MPNFICTICTTKDETKSFPSLQALQDHIKEVHSVEPTKTAQTFQEPSRKQPDKIRLKYQFVGDCPNCDLPVDTIEVELEDRFKEIAYCAKCRIQYDQVSVIPISKQYEKIKSGEIAKDSIGGLPKRGRPRKGS